MCEARIPSFFSFLPCLMPLLSSRETMKDAWPRIPSSGSTVATTMWTSAIPPFVAKTFVPLRTQPPSTFSAFVRSDETSEPALGSVTQNAATFGSSGVPNIRGAHVRSCSGVPAARQARTAEVPCRRSRDRCRRIPSRSLP